MSNMDQFDEILKIFEYQKGEIDNLSSKVNQLEKTNLYLMTVMERSSHIPPVFDPGAMESDKMAAMEKEATLYQNLHKHLNKDSTCCDITLNESFDNSMCSDAGKEDITTFSPPQKVYYISKSDDINRQKNNVNDKKLFRSLNLKMSNKSPTKRRNRSRNLLDFVACQNRSGDSFTGFFNSQDNEIDSKLFDTVVENKSSPNITTKSDRSSKSEESNKLNKSNSFHDSPNDKNLHKALDFVIETLQASVSGSWNRSLDEKSELVNSPKFCSDDYVSYAEKLKEELEDMNRGNDEHSRIKLLLTTQQLKSDLIHNYLEKNNDELYEMSTDIIHNNSNGAKSNSSTSYMEKINYEKKIEENNTVADMKKARREELYRINNRFQELDKKTLSGFEKFTAVVKGYLVRTLLQTERVRNVIITIKDTAQMALNIRQERLSGDCALLNESDSPGHATLYGSRRTHQEALVFQHRLVAQLRAALKELHEIFFEWSTAERIALIRRHIDRLISVATTQLSTADTLTDSTDVSTTLIAGLPSSSSAVSKMKNVAPPTSATLKRRQQLALRHQEGNLKAVQQLSEGGGDVKPIESRYTGSTNKVECSTGDSKQFTASTTKSTAISASSAKCGGYASRKLGTPTGKPANASQPGCTNSNRHATNRKPRSNSNSRRRSALRAGSKFIFNKVSKSPQSFKKNWTRNALRSSTNSPMVTAAFNCKSSLSHKEEYGRQKPCIKSVPKESKVTTAVAMVDKDKISSSISAASSNCQRGKQNNSHQQQQQQQQYQFQQQQPQPQQPCHLMQHITTSICSSSKSEFRNDKELSRTFTRDFEVKNDGDSRNDSLFWDNLPSISNNVETDQEKLRTRTFAITDEESIRSSLYQFDKMEISQNDKSAVAATNDNNNHNNGRTTAAKTVVQMSSSTSPFQNVEVDIIDDFDFTNPGQNNSHFQQLDDYSIASDKFDENKSERTSNNNVVVVDVSNFEYQYTPTVDKCPADSFVCLRKSNRHCHSNNNSNSVTKTPTRPVKMPTVNKGGRNVVIASRPDFDTSITSSTSTDPVVSTANFRIKKRIIASSHDRCQ